MCVACNSYDRHVRNARIDRSLETTTTTKMKKKLDKNRDHDLLKSKSTFRQFMIYYIPAIHVRWQFFSRLNCVVHLIDTQTVYKRRLNCRALPLNSFKLQFSPLLGNWIAEQGKQIICLLGTHIPFSQRWFLPHCKCCLRDHKRLINEANWYIAIYHLIVHCTNKAVVKNVKSIAFRWRFMIS